MNIQQNRQLTSTLNTGIGLSPKSNNLRMTSRCIMQKRGREEEEDQKEISEGRRREFKIQKKMK